MADYQVFGRVHGCSWRVNVNAGSKTWLYIYKKEEFLMGRNSFNQL